MGFDEVGDLKGNQIECRVCTFDSKEGGCRRHLGFSPDKPKWKCV